MSVRTLRGLTVPAYFHSPIRGPRPDFCPISTHWSHQPCPTVTAAGPVSSSQCGCLAYAQGILAGLRIPCSPWPPMELTVRAVPCQSALPFQKIDSPPHSHQLISGKASQFLFSLNHLSFCFIHWNTVLGDTLICLCSSLLGSRGPYPFHVPGMFISRVAVHSK